MTARLVLAAGLFALALGAAPAQQPKKTVPPKLDFAKIAAAQKALTGIGCQLSPESDRKSPHFGQIKQVSFPRTTNDDDLAAALPHLLALPALTALDLGYSQVTDAGAAHLAKLPRLEAVYLDGLKVGAKTLDVLAAFPELHWLVVTGGAFQKAELASLGKVGGLQHLEVGLSPTVTAADLEPFNSLGGLRDLTVTGGGKVGPEGVRHLTSPRRLTSLALGTIPVGDEEAKVLGEATSLKSLTFYPGSRLAGAGTRLTDTGVQSLTNLRSLNALSLSGEGVTLAGVTGFAEMKELTSLSLAGCPVEDAGLQKALALPALASLQLTGTKATFENVGGLNRLPKLVSLYVASTPVSDDGLKNLVTLPAVQTLSLSGTAVTDAGLKHLPKLRTLQSLTLTDGLVKGKAAAGRFTGDGLKNLAGSNVRDLTVHAAIDGTDLKGLAGCKNLTNLTISNTTTDDTALKGLTGVRTLRVVWAVDTQATKVGKAAVERAVPGSIVHLEYPKSVAGPYVRTPGARTTSP